MRILVFLALLIFMPSLFACDESEAKVLLSKLEWITEDYPPYNYKNESGQLVGIFPEVLTLIYEGLGIDRDVKSIQILPWSRLLMYMEYYPNYAAFSMVTTPKRADRYKLVSLPIKAKISILALRSNIEELKSKQLDELTVAVVRGDIGQSLLYSQRIPVKQVDTVSAASMLNMLMYKRVDAIAYSENVAYYQFQKLGGNRDNFTSVLSLDDNSKINFVFNKVTSQCAVNMFIQELAKLQQNGKIKPIWNKYIQE